MSSTSAPGNLAIVQDFVNTVEIEHAADPLNAEDQLPDWCTNTGFCPGIDQASLRRLREFRESLRGVLEANAGDGEATERWSALEPFAGRAGYKMYITPAGVPALRPEGSGADAAIAAVLAIVYDAIGNGTWTRLKTAANTTAAGRSTTNPRMARVLGAACRFVEIVRKRSAAAREKSHTDYHRNNRDPRLTALPQRGMMLVVTPVPTTKRAAARSELRRFGIGVRSLKTEQCSSA